MNERNEMLQSILGSIQRSPLPAAHTTALREAIVALCADRPNAVDKIQAPLGRALRNPMFPEIWTRCVADIPTSAVYTGVREAAQGIAAFVAAHKPG
jgi:hypothetical protein